MIVGEVIYPEAKSRKKIKCDCCDLSYSHSSYNKLIENYKLIYLDSWSTETEYCSCTLCHDCFFDNLKKISQEYELEESGIPFFIFNKTTELELNFHPEEFVSEELKEDAEDSNMEDFIKDILEA